VRESQPFMASTISAFGSTTRPIICASVDSQDRGGRPYRSARCLASSALCPRVASARETLTSQSSKHGVGRFILAAQDKGGRPAEQSLGRKIHPIRSASSTSTKNPPRSQNSVISVVISRPQRIINCGFRMISFRNSHLKTRDVVGFLFN
jgi:hypothetical protein